MVINNFLQNNFNIGDDLSSSDGETVTISMNSMDQAAQQPAEPQPEEPQPAEPQPAEPPPAARKSKRPKMPRKYFSL